MASSPPPSARRTIERKQELLRTRQFTVQQIEYRLPGGKLISRALVQHPGAVVIVPQEADGRIVLVRQFRSSVGEFLLELPAGTREPSEEPLVTAKRELAEEVSRSADRWELLGELFPAPGFCDEKQYIFFASGLSAAHAQGDEDEEIEVVPMTLAEIDRAIADNVIRDGKTLAGLSLAKAHGMLR